MTTALTAPEGADFEGAQTEWPGPLPGAEPLPGQLDRWLAARGAELVAIRRHIHAHPEPSHHEFETAALVARELAVAGLSPRLLPKGNGVICDIGEGDRVIAFRADLDALPLQDPRTCPTAPPSTASPTPAATTCTPPCCSASAWPWPSSTSRASCPAGSG